MKNILTVGVATIAMTGIAFAGSAPRSAAPIKINKKNSARMIKVANTGSRKMMVGVTVGSSMVQKGTLKDQVKNGQAFGIFGLMPLPMDKVSLILDAAMTKYKEEAGKTKKLDKVGASAGLIYNVMSNDSGAFHLGLGGEVGFAKYETKAAGTSTAAGKDESKVFIQGDVLATYNFDSFSLVGKASYGGVSLPDLDGLNLKDSNYLGASIGIAKSF
jgi:hypothetical protein